MKIADILEIADKMVVDQNCNYCVNNTLDICEMADKLREIMELMPHIQKGLRLAKGTAEQFDDIAAMMAVTSIADTLNKIEAWVEE